LEEIFKWEPEMIKVVNLQDETYQVIEIDDEDDFYSNGYCNILHQGGLADCEAYIRLKERGYL